MPRLSSPTTVLLFIVATLLLLCSCFISGAKGQEENIGNPPECQQWWPNVTGTEFCTAYSPLFAGQYIFVPNDKLMGTWDGLQSTLAGTIQFIAALIEVDPVCRKDVLAHICGLFLRPCLMIDDEPIPTPQQSCQSVCQANLDGCQAYRDKTGFPAGVGLYYPPGFAEPLTCNETDVFSNDQLMYPDEGYFYYPNDNNTSNATWVPCLIYNDTVDYFYCIPPLEANYETEYCSFTCPLPTFTDEELDGIKIMQGLLGWLSWAATLFLIISYLINPKLRTFPSNLVIMTAIAVHVVSIGIILPSMAGYTRTWCGADTQFAPLPTTTFVGDDPSDQDARKVEYELEDLIFESDLCSLQGAFLHYGLVAGTLWWGIIAFNMFLQIYFVVTNVVTQLNKTRNKIILQVIYGVIGWGVPFILMLIPTSAGQVSYVAGATFCFLGSQDNNAWQLVFWFIPVGIVLLVGSILFILAMVQTIRLCIKSLQGQSKKTIKSTLPVFIRLLCFILIFWILYIFIFLYRIVYEATSDDISQAYNEYFSCFAEGGGSSCDFDDGAGTYELSMLQGFAVSSIGIFLFFTFLSLELFMQWGRIAIALFNFIACRGPGGMKGLYTVFHVLKTGTTISSSTTGTGSKMTITTHMGEVNEMNNLGEDEDEEDNEEEEETSEDKDQTEEDSDDTSNDLEDSSSSS